jgi:NTF2-related export protein 1/2
MLPTTMPDGKPLPAITYNGNVLPTAIDLQKMFQDQMPAARYEVQSYDCQVINPNYIAVNSQGAVSTAGKNMTILVTVSGYVKYGGSRDAATRGFSESFVLVPNHDFTDVKGQGKKPKDWLIQSQTFRIVV